MTKKELIEALREFPDDTNILIFDEETTQEIDFVGENTQDGAAVLYMK